MGAVLSFRFVPNFPNSRLGWIRAFCQPFGHCILSSVCFTLDLFENCQTTAENLHLALEPALSAEMCHLDARKRVATQLQIEKCIVFQSLPQLSSTGWGFKANQGGELLRWIRYWHDFRLRSKVIE